MDNLPVFSPRAIRFFLCFLPFSGLSFSSPIPITPGKVIKEWPVAKKGNGIKTVVLDAGHGGRDPGCSGVHAQEKHIVLNIALKLAAHLRQNHPEVNVILTRDKDIFVPLHERAAIANRHNADLFISIHCNAMPGSAIALGTETYVMGLHTAAYNLQVAKRENEAILFEDNFEQHYDFDPNSPEGHIFLSMYQNTYLEKSIQFAELVEQTLNGQAQRKSRGVKQAGFMVLKATAMPSVLIETGFLSNRTEEDFLRTEVGQTQIAHAISEAFSIFKADVDNLPLAASEAPTPVPKPILVSNNTQPTLAQPVMDSNERAQNLPQGGTQALNINIPPKATSPLRSAPVQPGLTINALSIHIQLAASSNAKTQEARFQRLPFTIEVIQENNLFKYRTTPFPKMQDALKALETLKNSGFLDAFIVVYQGGKRIPIEEAKKYME